MTLPSMADRFAVQHRAHRKAPWRDVVTVGDKAAAERLMLRLAVESKTSGDWRVGKAQEPSR